MKLGKSWYLRAPGGGAAFRGFAANFLWAAPHLPTWLHLAQSFFLSPRITFSSAHCRLLTPENDKIAELKAQSSAPSFLVRDRSTSSRLPYAMSDNSYVRTLGTRPWPSKLMPRNPSALMPARDPAHLQSSHRETSGSCGTRTPSSFDLCGAPSGDGLIHGHAWRPLNHEKLRPFM